MRSMFLLEDLLEKRFNKTVKRIYGTGAILAVMAVALIGGCLTYDVLTMQQAAGFMIIVLVLGSICLVGCGAIDREAMW